MEDYKELSREQVRAITRGISLGRTLQEDHPEIAVMYGYYSQRDITKMLDTQSEYGVSDDDFPWHAASDGVRYAINGHDGSFGIEGYVGLITDEKEREWLRREHKVLIGMCAKCVTRKSETNDGRFCKKCIKRILLEDYSSLSSVRDLSRKGTEEIGRAARDTHTLDESAELNGQKSYEQGSGFHGRTAEQIDFDEDMIRTWF